ncbi:hypothetical protein A8B75_06865 [Sphingomonadales bacterium EhC05]|uniref:TauD/TfdA family dioxygenase n=1 Tax=Parasphingorhabdus sp. TaxID=2709688 RepID=UPI0007F5051D|nr:hypothetical protein A8B75_06865 [Sphingomonadales bacterium EhC05]
MSVATPIKSKADWRASQWRKDDSWIYHLSESQIAELDAALTHAKGKGLTGIAIKRDDFPLPSLGPVLDELAEELVNGRGFFLIRGFPALDYSKEDASSVFWGMGNYIGSPWPQNARGDVLGDVRDTGRSILDPTVRGYQTNIRLPFHTDGSDLVGLMCLRTSKTGGLSSIVSSVACHNELARSRPELCERHYSPFAYDWRGEEKPGSTPYYEMPTFTRHDGRLFNRYIRGFIDSAQRFEELPRLSATDIKALDALDALTVDPDFRLDMELQPGDVQFVNNYVIFHSRTAYEDYEEEDRKRHLKRLWLSTDKYESRPDSFTNRGYDQSWWSQQAEKRRSEDAA